MLLMCFLHVSERYIMKLKTFLSIPQLVAKELPPEFAILHHWLGD